MLTVLNIAEKVAGIYGQQWYDTALKLVKDEILYHPDWVRDYLKDPNEYGTLEGELPDNLAEGVIDTVSSEIESLIEANLNYAEITNTDGDNMTDERFRKRCRECSGLIHDSVLDDDKILSKANKRIPASQVDSDRPEEKFRRFHESTNQYYTKDKATVTKVGRKRVQITHSNGNPGEAIFLEGDRYLFHVGQEIIVGKVHPYAQWEVAYTEVNPPVLATSVDESRRRRRFESSPSTSGSGIVDPFRQQVQFTKTLKGINGDNDINTVINGFIDSEIPGNNGERGYVVISGDGTKQWLSEDQVTFVEPDVSQPNLAVESYRYRKFS